MQQSQHKFKLNSFDSFDLNLLISCDMKLTTTTLPSRPPHLPRHPPPREIRRVLVRFLARYFLTFLFFATWINNFFSSYVRLSRDLALGLSCYGHMKLTTTTFPSRPPHLPHRRTFGQQKHPSRNEADKEMPHLFFWILLHNMVLPCTSQRTLGSNSTSLHRCNISISRSE